MERFIEILKEKGTDYEVISDNEIIIPVIALVATKEQYENNALASTYSDNPFFLDEVKIQLTFKNGYIDWMVVVPPEDSEPIDESVIKERTE